MILEPDIPDLSSKEIVEIDDELADAGVPVLRRPIEAAKLWGERHGGAPLGLPKERIFRQAYRELHPSVPFDSESFLTLCVSARAVSYFIKPPLAYGRVGIQPIKHTDITENELARLYHQHPTAFWELYWQAFDAIDLFMALMNFHPTDVAAQNMMETAVNQMTASARQLVACEFDSSLPQGMALSCELAGKAVLLRCGADATKLRTIGHDIPKLIDEIRATGRLPSSPVEAQVSRVAAEMPKYVSVRYSSPTMSMLGAQDLFRKSMFLIADLLRQTNHDQGYWRKLSDGDMPERSFENFER